MTKEVSEKTVELQRSQYDTLVVGAGLAGVLAAGLRARQGKHVLLVDAAAMPGGRWSPERREGFQLGAGLGFADPESWSRACDAVGIPFTKLDVKNGESIQFNNKGWQAAADLPRWEEYFARPVSEVPAGGVAAFIEQVLQNENIELVLNAPITELKVAEGMAKSATVGADKVIQFEECLWAADYKTLGEVLQGDEIPAGGAERNAWLHRFVASPYSPGVVLEFAHATPVSEFSETLVLPLPPANEKEKKKDHRRYVIGAFLANRDASLAPEGKQISSWIFPLSEAEWEDNHEILKRIRAARRTIGRCFSGFEDSILFDRVQVLSHTVTPLRFARKQRVDVETSVFPNLIPVADWASPFGSHFEGVVGKMMESLQSESNTAD